MAADIVIIVKLLRAFQLSFNVLTFTSKSINEIHCILYRGLIFLHKQLRVSLMHRCELRYSTFPPRDCLVCGTRSLCSSLQLPDFQLSFVCFYNTTIYFKLFSNLQPQFSVSDWNFICHRNYDYCSQWDIPIGWIVTGICTQFSVASPATSLDCCFILMSEDIRRK